VKRNERMEKECSQYTLTEVFQKANEAILGQPAEEKKSLLGKPLPDRETKVRRETIEI